MRHSSPLDRFAVLFVPLLLSLLSEASLASGEVLTPAQLAPILARVLAYDRTLLDRAGDQVVIAVVHQPTDPASVDDGKRMLAGFKALEHLPLKGKPFRVVAVPYGPTAMADAQRVHGADAVYLCDGLKAEIGAIVGATRKLKLMSMAGTDAYAELGVAIGVALENDKPRLLVNATASREEGAQLSSDLLRFAKVTK